MDSFELNKIGGAVLFALLIFMGIREVRSIVNPEPHDVVGYAVPGVEEDTGGGSVAPVEIPFAQFLAQGSADAGARVYNKCKQCHTIEEGGRNGTGPNLYNIVGEKLAHLDNFNYSSALREKGGVWDYDALDAWLENPRSYIPKNKMAYGGIRDDEDRANLILYLAANSVNPPPLPEVAMPATEEPALETSAVEAPDVEESAEMAAEAVTEAVSEEAAPAVENPSAPEEDVPTEEAPVDDAPSEAEPVEEESSGDVPVEEPAETPSETPGAG